MLSADGVVEEFGALWLLSDLRHVMPEPLVIANRGLLELTLIEVPQEHRGKGYADKAMNMLTAICDENGVTIKLVAREMDSLRARPRGGLDTQQLVDWYRETHCFVETCPPGGDTREMIREAGRTKRLRAALEEMVCDLEKNPVEAHPERLREIAREMPHTILILPSDVPLAQYNCVMFALGIERRLKEKYEHPLLVAKTGLLAHFIDTGVLKFCKPQIGAIVIWSSQNGIKHTGRMIKHRRVQSKWGIGNLYEHGLWEIPKRYGENVAFYMPIDPDTAMERLRKFLWPDSSDQV